MIKNQIKLRQICALFIALVPLTKIVSAPSIFARFCGEKLLQPLFVLCILDLCLIALFCLILKRNEGKSAYQILSEGYSELFAKVIFFIYALFFLTKSFIPLLEHKELVENAFYETLPKAPVFYPLIAVTFFIALKGFKTIGRVSELFLPITLAGLAFIIYLSLLPGDYTALLPLLKTNKSVAICSLNGILWFNDAIYLLMFLGNFKREKNTFLKLGICYFIPIFLTAIIYASFYSIFSYVAPSQKIAVSSMSIFSITLVNVGRFDYFAVFLLSLASVLAVALPIACATKCITVCFNFKSSLIPALITNLLLFALIIAVSRNYEGVLGFYFKYLIPFMLICAYILPLLLLKRRNKNALQTL